MKKLGTIILGIILFTTFKYQVHAENITYQRLNDIYYNLTVDGKTQKNHVTKFFLDGRLAYCIDPGAPINTKTYNSSNNWDATKLTPYQQDQIEKIGYYGYEYPKHQTDKYYIATQELIWQQIKNVGIKWTNSKDQTIDITKEKQEIESLVQKHTTLPSFTGETITGKLNETKTIIDTNNILQDFNISNPNYHQIKVENNKIVIQFSPTEQEEEITMQRKKYDTKTSLIYQYPGSQSLAAIRLSSKENYSFKIKSEKKPEKKEIKKQEIVMVPNTSTELNIKTFGVKKFKYYDERIFY